MSLKTIIAAIGQFFESLFNNTKKDFNNLPKEQQDAIIQGVNVAQVIKETYKSGKDAVISAITQKTGISADVATATILAIAKDLGLDTASVEEAINHIADKAQAAITDNGWNALWQDIAQFGATWLSTGQLNWITLGLGVVEFAYQNFIKGVK